MMQPVPATMPMTVKLQAQVWNAIISALGKEQHYIVAPLIQAIQEQLQEQAEKPPANGLDARPAESLPV